MRWLIAVPVCAFCVAVLALAGVLMSWRLPPPTGPLPVGTTLLQLTDPSRAETHTGGASTPRELAAQVWYPAAPSRAPLARYRCFREAGLPRLWQALLPTHSRWNAPVAPTAAPLRVLLFGHRWNGERTQDTALAEDLASHGYVVVAVDHPYNTSRVRLGSGRLVRASMELDQDHSVEQTERQWNAELAVWAADDSFVLNELARQSAAPGGLFSGRLNTGEVGAFGHSFGGAAALRLCGTDARVRAAANLDGWTLGGLESRTAEQAVVMLYGVPIHPLPPGSGETAVVAGVDVADKAIVDASLAAYGGEEIQIHGAQHLDFTDQPLLPPLHRAGYTGPIAPFRMQQILRVTLLHFFDAQLSPARPADWDTAVQAFPELRVQRNTANAAH